MAARVREVPEVAKWVWRPTIVEVVGTDCEFTIYDLRLRIGGVNAGRVATRRHKMRKAGSWMLEFAIYDFGLNQQRMGYEFTRIAYR